jgi:hypothetical protein
MSKTDISIILDRSGSMTSIAGDITGGFNQFLADQRKLDGQAIVSLFQFDHEYETVYAGIDLRDAPDLNAENYVPRGSTGLYDAIGRTVVATGSRLAALPEDQRPERVLVLIITDGLENSSREFYSDKIAEMVSHQRDKYNWEFMFIGANQDAVLSAKNLEIPTAGAVNFVANTAGVQAMYASVTRSVSNYRQSGDLSDETQSIDVSSTPAESSKPNN